MAKTNTEKLAARPDDKLKAVIESVQATAVQTQSEAYHYITSKEHGDVDAGDVLEIRCAPDPAMRAKDEAQLPAPRHQWAGFVLEQNGALYRCHGKPLENFKGEPPSEVYERVSGDQTLTLDPTDRGWRLLQYSWVEVNPSWADRCVSPKTDVQLRVFAGMAGEQEGTIKVHPQMALGAEGAPREN